MQGQEASVRILLVLERRKQSCLVRRAGLIWRLLLDTVRCIVLLTAVSLVDQSRAVYYLAELLFIDFKCCVHMLAHFADLSVKGR